jgi:glycosyltransferase involved in cell wall biosynthesis
VRIAILAPLVEPVPPPLYGGTERVVSLLTEELVRRGHDVTLFASGDSQTAATLVPVCPRGLRRDMVGLAAAGQATGSAWWAPDARRHGRSGSLPTCAPDGVSELQHVWPMATLP